MTKTYRELLIENKYGKLAIEEAAENYENLDSVAMCEICDCNERATTIDEDGIFVCDAHFEECEA